METQSNSELAIVPIEGRIVDESTLGMDLPEDEDINSPDHPNFIESNTAAISLEDLATKCIVPTFGDMSLTISHQNFMASWKFRRKVTPFFSYERDPLFRLKVIPWS